MLEIRRDSAPEIIVKGQIIQEGEEFIKIQVFFDSEQIALANILRHTPNIKVLEPSDLVAKVKEALARLVTLHAD